MSRDWFSHRRPLSFSCLAALALIGIHRTALAQAEGGFPYTAYVAVDGAELVSGPGHRYYATMRLARGTEIEIYNEEPSGWLAIRPPDGSFSWVPAECVERSTEDPSIGRIQEPTPAWIGTTVERVDEHRHLVTLKTDELVAILGEKQVASAASPQIWLKIAPPAGEFRWIHLRDVSRHPPQAVAPEDPAVPAGEPADDVPAPLAVDDSDESAADDSAEPRRFAPAAGAIALRDLAPAPERAVSPAGRALQAQPVALAQFRGAETAPPRTLSPDGFVPRKRKSSEPLETVPVPSQRLTGGSPTFKRPQIEQPLLVANSLPVNNAPATADEPAPAAAKARPAPGAASPDPLQQLELELSLMVAQDRATWNLPALADRVRQIVENGSDPVARGQARLLLDKIAKFQETFEVGDFGPISTPGAGPAGTAGQSASASAAAPGAGGLDRPAPSAADPRYDGTGWLKPVVSRRSDKPLAPYALVDAEGKAVTFVTPSPGMNLNRYLNKQVGVYGRRGYIESLKASHVTVERIIDLDRVVR